MGRRRSAWRAPSLSMPWSIPLSLSLSSSLKVALIAYAFTLSLRFVVNFHQHHSTSTAVQKFLEDYSVAPLKSWKSTQSTHSTSTGITNADAVATAVAATANANARRRARKLVSRQHHRNSSLSFFLVNDTNPLLMKCLCTNTMVTTITTTTTTTTTNSTPTHISHFSDHGCRHTPGISTKYSSTTFDILNRDPRRIPTYIHSCPQVTFFGYVFRDLVNRLFPKSFIPFNPNQRKHTVIVSDEAVRASQDLRWTHLKDRDISKWQRHYGYNIGASTYMSSKSRGYQVHAINSNSNNTTSIVTVDDWWQLLSSKATNFNNDIWFALFDPTDMTQQDDLVTRSAAVFLREASIDYIVFRVDVTPDQCYGKRAANHLLLQGYQLQILSSSHTGMFDRIVERPKKGNTYFGPNRQIRNQEELNDIFLYWRKLITSETTKQQNSFFVGYLFATKTMDMAIPITQEFINLTGVETADIVLNVDGDAIPYKTCRPSAAQISWSSQNTTTTTTNTNKPQEEFHFRCSYGSDLNRTWYSGSTPQTSEIICGVCPNPTQLWREELRLENSACVSRFLPNEDVIPPVSGKPNILFILLEQVSRDRFEKLMPRTKLAMVNGGFGGFLAMDRYLATSEYPNQQKQIIVSGTTSSEPVLARLLQENGYATLSAGNFCNSSLFLGKVNTSFYGDQLNEMMCRLVPARPHCIGGRSVNDHLFDYTNSFLNHYRDHKKNWAVFLSFVEGTEETGVLPGTIDGQLSSLIRQLRNNMTKSEWDNTLIVVSSDTGAIHGSFSHSFVGQQELVKPLLYFKAASGSTKGNAAVKQNRLRYATPFDLHRTIVETIVTRNQSLAVDSMDGISLVTPLPDTRLNCNDVAEIPRSICDLLDISSSEPLQKRISLESFTPPSILSFYADIPKHSRNHIQVEVKRELPKRANVTNGCKCATNIEKWFPCDKHPWNAQSPTSFKEFFMLVDCPDQPTHLELNVFENHVLTKRVDGRLSKIPSKQFPNIIFLEVDSVSGVFADRHFPKTREFLKQFRIHQSRNGTFSCVDGICSADLSEHITLAGANSIPNQVAALSGCISSDFEHRCGIKEEDLDVNLYCNDPSEPHHGLQIHRLRLAAKQIYWCPPQPGREKRTTPWLFGITDSLGYINYFGEEFCYEGSPYVTQGNVFPAFFSDISPHLVFCRLAELRIQREKADVADEFRWGYEKQDQACVESDASDCTFEKARISLELMEQMWNVYPNHPKLAFLNVLAAHVYNADWSKVFLAAERYDDHLSSFLERMVSRADFSNTVIVVRSDHGLQRGPTAMNYNIQVEHTRPWTEVLVPESLPGLSKQALFENQFRLTSGLDIYHTLRSLMDSEKHATPWPPLPDWSYNIFATIVPVNRTCGEARVDKELCREQSIIPSFGICNSLDPKQRKFCRSYEVQPVVSPKDLPPSLPMPRIKITGQAQPFNMTINITKVKELLAKIK